MTMVARRGLARPSTPMTKQAVHMWPLLPGPTCSATAGNKAPWDGNYLSSLEDRVGPVERREARTILG